MKINTLIIRHQYDSPTVRRYLKKKVAEGHQDVKKLITELDALESKENARIDAIVLKIRATEEEELKSIKRKYQNRYPKVNI